MLSAIVNNNTAIPSHSGFLYQRCSGSLILAVRLYTSPSSSASGLGVVKRARTQKSFVTFLQEIRVSHACKLLRQYQLSVMKVALESGYNNLVNFNKCFKGITALSPSEYRKKSRSELVS